MKSSLNPVTTEIIASLQTTVTRLLSERYFGPLTLNLYLPYYDAEDSQFAKWCKPPTNHRFSWPYGAYHQSDIQEILRGTSHLTHCEPKDGQFGKCCYTPLNHRSHVVVWCLSSERYFGPPTVKSSLHPIKTQDMAYLQNDVKGLEIIVFV